MQRTVIEDQRCQLQGHFPSSTSILGPKLGVECSASGPRRHCKKKGHWSGECSAHWATNQMCFPVTGRFSAQRQTHGGPLRVFWDGVKKPVKETARAWVKFLQNRKHSLLWACPLSSQSTESRRIPGADRQGGSMATHGSGAGSRMKRDDFDSQRITAPMACESGLLHRICSHVNFV
jgi:hypothetical protein